VRKIDHTMGKCQPRAKARRYREFVRRGATSACVGLALLMGGCDPRDKGYFKEGIGTDLYTIDAYNSADLQNLYLESLCRESLPFVGTDVPSCSGQGQLSVTAWPLIVQAGLNDIDQRCDAYLSWLDQKKRENAAVLSEIGAIRVAVDAVTNPKLAPSVSPIGLAAIAAAFGLATSTLTNVSSLLLQVDHTTVQSVVFVNRRDFREKLLPLAITNKPMVIHSLRSYLEICMPMTISANINSTVTVFQQTAGFIERQPLVSTTTIGGTPIAPQQTIGKPNRSEIIVHKEFAQILDPYDPKVHSAPYVESIQRALCVPKNEVGTISPDTKALIKIYQATKAATNPDAKANGKLNAKEIEEVLGLGSCTSDESGQSAGPQNYFERMFFKTNPTGKKALADFIEAIKKLPGGKEQVTGTSLDAARKRIEEVRGLLQNSAKLTKLPRDLANQVTPDLYQAVMPSP
jgi:hypothetical protein